MAAGKAKQLVVAAALVQAKVGNRILHFYYGDILPAGVDEESLENLKSLGYVSEVDAPGEPAADSAGYGDQKVSDLKELIAARNEGRDEADQISGDGVKADLIAALEADDNK